MSFMAPVISALGLALCVCAHWLAKHITRRSDILGRVEMNIRRIGEIAYFCGLLTYLVTNYLAV